MTHRDIEDGMGFGGLVESPEEREERISVAELKLRRRYMRALPFCPDHRDKVIGLPCRECEIERLKAIIRRVIVGHCSIASLAELIGDQ
mgnify:CR=1 FL=1